jgi:hypothetical protein
LTKSKVLKNACECKNQYAQKMHAWKKALQFDVLYYTGAHQPAPTSKMANTQDFQKSMQATPQLAASSQHADSPADGPSFCLFTTHRHPRCAAAH